MTINQSAEPTRTWGSSPAKTRAKCSPLRPHSGTGKCGPRESTLTRRAPTDASDGTREHSSRKPRSVSCASSCFLWSKTPLAFMGRTHGTAGHPLLPPRHLLGFAVGDFRARGRVGNLSHTCCFGSIVHDAFASGPLVVVCDFNAKTLASAADCPSHLRVRVLF